MCNKYRQTSNLPCVIKASPQLISHLKLIICETWKVLSSAKIGMDILNTEKDLEADQAVLDLPLFHKVFTFCSM